VATGVLVGIGRVTRFAGAIMAGRDLAELSYALAAASGIRIEDASAQTVRLPGIMLARPG
jgi:hypothetical protein